ncbi:MAG: hypothetical protein QOG53_3615 [Frankiales bacterium]|jgi:hypothetical protein|nr:hypothetical protein [Frankiales bacterium]
MKLDQKAADRLVAMLAKADDLLKTYKSPPSNFIGFEGWVDSELFAEWRAQSLVLLRQSLGREHQYTRSFQEGTEKESVPSSVRHGIGILRAASEDLSNGYLFEARSLIEAEVFDDFLQMAQHLNQQGYKDPAASLAGAVLEDGLRRIATGHEVPFSKSDGLDALNKAIASHGIYNKLTQSKVDSWRVIRNAADHGNFGEYGTEDVTALIEGVVDLLGRHLV